MPSYLSGDKGNRTPNLFHAMEARYQLRHIPVFKAFYCELEYYLIESGITAAESWPSTGSGIDPALCSVSNQPFGECESTDHEALESPPIFDQYGIGSSR